MLKIHSRGQGLEQGDQEGAISTIHWMVVAQTRMEAVEVERSGQIVDIFSG